MQITSFETIIEFIYFTWNFLINIFSCTTANGMEFTFYVSTKHLIAFYAPLKMTTFVSTIEINTSCVYYWKSMTYYNCWLMKLMKINLSRKIDQCNGNKQHCWKSSLWGKLIISMMKTFIVIAMMKIYHHCDKNLSSRWKFIVIKIHIGMKNHHFNEHLSLW